MNYTPYGVICGTEIKEKGGDAYDIGNQSGHTKKKVSQEGLSRNRIEATEPRKTFGVSRINSEMSFSPRR